MKKPVVPAPPPITPKQLREARGLLGWSQDQLVEASGVLRQKISRLELGDGNPRLSTLAAIRAVLEAAGVEFIAENGGGSGVRMRKFET